MILQKWTPQFSQELERVTHIPVWVLFPELDPYFWSCSALSKLASKIGKPLFADAFTTSKEKISFAGIMIEVDVSSDLPNHVILTSYSFLWEGGAESGI